MTSQHPSDDCQDILRLQSLICQTNDRIARARSCTQTVIDRLSDGNGRSEREQEEGWFTGY
jgi:hypothetical protein